MRNATLFALAFAASALLAGCVNPFASPPRDDRTYLELGFDGVTWPDLHGAEVVVLDHGAWTSVFEPAKLRFEALTNGTLEHIAAADAGDALGRAIREKDRPSFDVVYGLDNAYLPTAVAGNALRPYRPLLAGNIEPQYVFFDANGTWPATPVDHGYMAVNVDPRANLTIRNLNDVRDHAQLFVTEDPRTSSPGLGFLLATIATYGEHTAYDWRDYWRELLDGGATVTPDWTTAYTQHFTGGYGQWEPGFTGTKPIATSYSTSPAYEAFYGAEGLNDLVLDPRSTFHQIETVAIAANPRNLAAAQAFIEFCLTKEFQDLHAEYNAVYPVVSGVNVSTVYHGLDPAPGTFQDTGIEQDRLGANVERWVKEWTAVFEAS